MIADLEQIALKDRSVTLLYDNDVQSNEKVKAARNKFAWALRDEGAEVFLVDIPSGPVKLGIDDVIGADGDVAAMKIIDSAYPHKTVNGKAKNGKANGEAKNGKTNGHAAPTIDPTPVTASNWHDEWVLTEKGNVAACLANAVSLLRYHGEWQGVLWFNEFTLEVVARNKAPWAGSRAGKIWADVDDSLATEWMQRHKVVIHSSKVVAEAIQMVAHEHPFHPLRDAVDALEWDGVPRLNEWLIKYAGAPETPYVRAVSAAWVISMMARLYMPGCKSDYVLGLEGDQDLGKSMFLEVLPGKGYFVDRLSNLDTKDAMLEMAGVWVIELSELDNMKGVRQEKFKGFVTSHTDRFRDPYGRRPSWHPRQCVLCSTTNLSEPFQDPTGMRRIWPVRCGRIDVPGLRSVRLQLLAEARVRFNPKSPAISLDGIEGDGERWWLEDYELKQLAYAEQEQRYEPGVWDDNIIEWIAAPTRRWDSDKHEGVKPWDYSGPGKVTITDVLVHCCEKEIGRLTQGDRNQVKRCLEHEKWRKYQDRSGDTRGKRFYYSPERWEKEFYKDGSRKGNE
jgi:predicted P-loop ATPase